MSFCRRKHLSDLQARCLAAATTGPLVPFPRGFGVDRFGPFFPLRTVQGLIERKRLRIVRPQRGKHRIQVMI